MRRVEVRVWPDPRRYFNAAIAPLEGSAAILGAGDPKQAPERARRAIERVKQLESELGKIRRAEQGSEIDELAARATDVDGAKLVVQCFPERGAGELRELALRLRDRFSKEPAAVVLGGAGGGKSALVAALTSRLLEQGLAAPALLEPAARAIGGNAGGKP